MRIRILTIFSIFAAAVDLIGGRFTHESDEYPEYSRLDLELIVPKREIYIGEPLFAIVRIINESDKMSKFPGVLTFYNGIGLRVTRLSDGRLMPGAGLGNEGTVNYSLGPYTLQPGEYLEDGGYYPYYSIDDPLGGFDGDFDKAVGKYSVYADTFMFESDPVEITVLPPDDNELAMKMLDPYVVSVLAARGPNPKGLQLLREVAESGEDSVYVDIAKAALRRAEKGTEFAKYDKSYYRRYLEPGNSPVKMLSDEVKYDQQASSPPLRPSSSPETVDNSEPRDSQVIESGIADEVESRSIAWSVFAALIALSALAFILLRRSR